MGTDELSGKEGKVFEKGEGGGGGGIWQGLLPYLSLCDRETWMNSGINET